MRKIFLIGLPILIILPTIANADKVIDFTQDRVKCGRYSVTLTSTFEEVKQNCKVYATDRDVENGVVSYEAKFYPTNLAYDLECKFVNNKLIVCEIND